MQQRSLAGVEPGMLVLHHWLSSYFSYWYGSYVLTPIVRPGSKTAARSHVYCLMVSKCLWVTVMSGSRDYDWQIQFRPGQRDESAAPKWKVFSNIKVTFMGSTEVCNFVVIQQTQIEREYKKHKCISGAEDALLVIDLSKGESKNTGMWTCILCNFHHVSNLGNNFYFRFSFCLTHYNWLIFSVLWLRYIKWSPMGIHTVPNVSIPL